MGQMLRNNPPGRPVISIRPQILNLERRNPSRVCTRKVEVWVNHISRVRSNYNPTLSNLQEKNWILFDFVGLHKNEVLNLFWNNFVAACEKGGKSPSIVTEELGFNRSAVTAWKNGALPQVKNRKRIADYFGIPVEELMGEKKEPAGKGGLMLEWVDVEEAYKNATPEARAAAKAAALAVLENGKAAGKGE